jgi:DNA-binding XRE family transcriptional regulator
MDAENPFVALRHELGQTQETTARLAGVSRNFVIRCEQGIYTNPVNKLSKFLLSKTDPQTDLAFANSYYRYQTEVREDSYEAAVLPHQYPFSDYRASLMSPGWEHPLAFWIRGSLTRPSLTAVCLAFCVPQSVMWKWTKTPHLVNSVPSQFLLALEEAGYSLTSRDNLEQAYDDYTFVRRKSQLHVA